MVYFLYCFSFNFNSIDPEFPKPNKSLTKLEPKTTKGNEIPPLPLLFLSPSLEIPSLAFSLFWFPLSFLSLWHFSPGTFSLYVIECVGNQSQFAHSIIIVRLYQFFRYDYLLCLDSRFSLFGIHNSACSYNNNKIRVIWSPKFEPNWRFFGSFLWFLYMQVKFDEFVVSEWSLGCWASLSRENRL